MKSHSATDFQDCLVDVLRERERIQAMQIAIDDTREDNKRWLEQHARDYVINHILAALNWRVNNSLDGECYVRANLGVEVTIAHERTLRMDYFGFDTNAEAPLLIVEAKRPSLTLPIVRGGDISPDPLTHPLRNAFAEYLSGTVHDGTSIRLSDGLTAEWREYLGQLRDYVRAVTEVGSCPPRAVITNGRWFIIFMNPEDSFCSESVDPSTIAVIPSLRALSEDCRLIWEQLNYYSLCRTARTLEPAEVPFAISRERVQSCMRGIYLIHWDEPHRFQRVPRMTVQPVLFLRSEANTFIQVCTREAGEILPPEISRLADHLHKVEERSNDLLRSVEEVLKAGRLRVDSVEYHYADQEAFDTLPAVQHVHIDENGENGKRYVLVTGEHFHFLNVHPHYKACPYHLYESCSAESVAAPNTPMVTASSGERSYYRDGDCTHCANRDVMVAKRSPVTSENHRDCGLRSSGEGGAFCELWRVERYLCCRTCVYQLVCTSAKVFSPPCVLVTVEGTGPSVVSE